MPKIFEIIENWDEIQLTVDAQPRESHYAEDHDEVVNRFWESIFSPKNDIVHPEIEQDDEEEKTDEEED